MAGGILCGAISRLVFSECAVQYMGSLELAQTRQAEGTPAAGCMVLTALGGVGASCWASAAARQPKARPTFL